MEILSARRKHWPSNNVVLLVAVCFSSQETIFNRASVYENRCVMIKKKKRIWKGLRKPNWISSTKSAINCFYFGPPLSRTAT